MSHPSAVRFTLPWILLEAEKINLRNLDPLFPRMLQRILLLSDKFANTTLLTEQEKTDETEK